HLAPGDGRIDWQWVIAQLKRGDFQGPLVLELSGGEHEPVAEVLARASRARTFLQGIIRQQ
ncbi:MAG: hypothetical protein JWO94_3163, partial [Verrucomicrobiaceae bacterium]|nr:hypothetical protein [Verrucomicrobiaceae bacterium]